MHHKAGIILFTVSLISHSCANRCTSLYGTPTMFIDLYNHPNFKNYDVSSLNAGIMAGSTCPIEVVHDCVEKLNTKNIVVS